MRLTLASTAAMSALLMACGNRDASSLRTEQIGQLAQTLTIISDGTWHWYQGHTGVDADIPAQCLDGSATGFGINRPAGGGNNKILFWLDGGGFCYDQTTCTNSQLQNPHVVHTFYSQNEFNSDLTNAGDPNFQPPLPFLWSKPELSRGIFDRSSGTNNPFRNYTFVFVPYCSGDFHAGYNHDTTSNIPGRVPSNDYHMGALNTSAVFFNVLGSLPLASQVTLAGGSAGGFGAYLMYFTLRSLLQSSVPITVISDSGDPLWTGTPGNPPNQATWTRQGYFLQQQSQPNNGFKYGPDQESYIEDLMQDAWHLFAFGFGPPSGLTMQTPFGARGSFYRQQDIFVADQGILPASDKFGIIDGSDDWVYSWIIPMNTTASGKQPNIDEGLLDIQSNALGSNAKLWIVTNTSTPPNSSACVPSCSFLRPFNQHHGYLLDDVSVWGSNGSGVNTFLTSSSWMGIVP